MERITDFRIDSIEMDEAKFYSLPLKAQELIRAYAEFKSSGKPGILRFELPAYRWEEIQGAC